MKKFIPILILGVLILSTVSANAITDITSKSSTPSEIENTNGITGRDYTHTVLVEVGTATWCPSCPASNTAWHSIYGSGNYDFEYTELVYDKNSAAQSRFYQFNPKFVPTSYWDGGDYVYPGTNTGTFQNFLNLAGARTVPDIEADLQVEWLGNAQLDISLSVINNDAEAYGGRIRVYVLELESTKWNDYSGNPYYHAFLDFAINKPINIPAGDTYAESTIWDGATEGYPDIAQDNIQVILAVFGDEAFTGYSDPPTGNPFTGYLCEETIAATPTTNGGPLRIKSIDGGLFRIKAVIENTLDQDVSGINWKITVDGGAFIGTETTGDNLTIPANSEETITSDFILGFGKTTVKVEVWVTDGPSDERFDSGFILLFFLLL